jgi:hypothetical protein
MPAADIRWPPHPYRAGLCITDDTDAATLAGVRGVYEVLAALGLKASKTVWAFAPAEPCGIPALPESILRGITLEDREYFDYCLSLRERGFEICLHGASAGNNVRARTERALALIEERFGGAGTYICHAKNAENPYWHEKVAPRGAARWALAPLSRYRCSGEDPASPYFWGDLCLKHVRHIRLFRTRDVDTLARNPSMPYFDPEKPLVRGWFAATKRSFHDCTSTESLERLESAGGLCVLYQYLHRYADASGAVDPTFRADAERLAATPGVLVETTSALMERLRQIQGVFLARRGRELWVANANETPVEAIQVRVPGGIVDPAPGVIRTAEGARVPRLPAGHVVRLEAMAALDPGPRTIAIDAEGRGSIGFGFGRAFVNVGAAEWVASPALRLATDRCGAAFDPEFSTLKPMRRAPAAELYALLAGQLAIIGDEVLRKGRSLSSRKFLGARTITLEDHSSW